MKYLLCLCLLLSGCFYSDILPPDSTSAEHIGCQSHNGDLFCLTRYAGQGRFVAETEPTTPTTYDCTIETISQVYDGDTITNAFIAVADIPFPVFSPTGEVFPNIVLTDSGVYVQNGIRIAGIDTPEIRTSKKLRDGTPRTQTSRDNEKKAAIAARNVVRKLVGDNGLRFTIGNVEMDKFGRVLGEVYVGDVNVGEYLIENGHALEYHGGTRVEWDNWE